MVWKKGAGSLIVGEEGRGGGGGGGGDQNL